MTPTPRAGMDHRRRLDMIPLSRRPTLSVALVTRNRPRSLDRCLSSWHQQTVLPHEIVVSDDSGDAMAPLTEAVTLKHRCVYVRGPRQGLYANRNYASLACQGTHILSADDDHTHQRDYVSVIMSLIEADPTRIWIFSEQYPDRDTPLFCPPELHRSGFGCAPANPTHCAAIADGATVYPRQVFDSGLRYDTTYGFGGMWYLWGQHLAKHGWRISFSDLTFVWHHQRPDGVVILDDGRSRDHGQLQQQLLATTYVQFVDALWLRPSVVRLAWASAYQLRRMLFATSILEFDIRTRLPLGGVASAIKKAWRARDHYRHWPPKPLDYRTAQARS